VSVSKKKQETFVPLLIPVSLYIFRLEFSRREEKKSSMWICTFAGRAGKIVSSITRPAFQIF
jgi:hypothetical protein